MTLTRRIGWRWPATAFVVGLAFGAIACACNVPVFRFALERWSPDVYRVTVLHRGPLSDVQSKWLQPLEESQAKKLANIAIRTLDLKELGNPDDAGAAGWLRDRDWSGVKEGEALLVVQYPEHLRIEVPAWMAPLDAEAVGRLLRSPVRQELVRRLTDGQTAVWLLLECGDAEKDEAAAEFLQHKLPEIQPTLKLPELTSDPDDELLASTPLKVEFSVLRVPQGAAEEAALAGMLVHCESDLADRVEPLVFPVFGRGRSLWPLVGRGINAKNVQEACEFLVGACSCQVKDQNPGFDLLLATDWNSLVLGDGQRFTAMQTRGALAADGAAELVPIPKGSPNNEPQGTDLASQSAATGYSSSFISAAVLIGVAAFVFLLAASHAGKS